MVVVFPDVHAAAIKHLAQYVPDWAVWPELPGDYDGRHIAATVTTATGPRYDYVLRTSRITVDVYGPNQKAAEELAELLNGVLLDWWLTEPLIDLPRGGGDVSGPQWWPDPETRWHRYVFTVEVVSRGSTIIPAPVV